MTAHKSERLPRLAVSAAVAVVMAFLVGCAAGPLTRGRKYVEAGNYQRGIDLIYEEIARHPANMDAWRELGVAFYKNGDLVKAEDALKNADPSHAETHLYLGLVFEARNEYRSAIDAYATALAAGPSSHTKGLAQRRMAQLVKETIKSEVDAAIAHQESLDIESIPDNTLAVVQFDGAALPADLKPLTLGLAVMTTTDLSKVHSLRLVERLKVEALLDELKLGEAGVTAEAPRVGRLLGSRRIVTGNLLNVENRVRLDGTIVDVSSGVPNLTDPAESELNRIFTMQNDFVFTVLDTLGITLTPEERDAIEDVPTESYVAFLAYCRGLEMARQGRWEEARQQFHEALDKDPNFSMAKQEMQFADATMMFNHSGPVTMGQLEASVTQDLANAGSQPTGSRLTTVLIQSGGVPSETTETPEPPVTAPPSSGGVGSVSVRGNLDGD